jgi:hypothetical protein
MPRPYDLAVFSLEVYGDSGDNSVLPPGRIPHPWKFNVTSETFGIKGESYYGKVYTNDLTKEYVISHRGTVIGCSVLSPASYLSCFDNILTDLHLVNETAPTAFTNYALPFVNQAMALLEPLGYSLSGITGHSLGAAHAMLSADSLRTKDIFVTPTLFEFPRPTSVNNSSYAIIYNAAPNGINSMNNPGADVIRLNIPVSNLAFIETFFYLPPTSASYALFTISQHRMAGLLEQFDPITGLPKISSNTPANSWPGFVSYSIDESVDYGLEAFIDYGLNTFYLRNAIISNWKSKLGILPSECRLGFKDFISCAVDKYYRPSYLPKIGVSIIGDNTGHIFRGGTIYNDTYQGGTGDDTYLLFGGSDNITDTGGINIYKIYSPISGSASIKDPGTYSQIYFDDMLARGTMYEITRYAYPISSASGRILQEYSDSQNYAIIGDKIATIATADSGNMKISNLLTGISNGNYISLQNYSSGDFGIYQASSTPGIDLGSLRLFNYIIEDEEFYYGSNLYQISSSSFFNIGIGPNPFKIINLNGNIDTIYIPCLNIDCTAPAILSSAFSEATGRLGLKTNEIKYDGNNTLIYNIDYYRVYDSAGNNICIKELPTGNSGYYIHTSDSFGNFYLTNIINFDTSNCQAANGYLYKISSIDCALSMQLQLSSGTIFPTLVSTNGDMLAVTFRDCFKDLSVKFYDNQLSLLSSYNIISNSNQLGLSMNDEGEAVILSSKSTSLLSSNTHLTIVDKTGILMQKTIDPISALYIQIIWLDNNNFAFMGIYSSNMTGDFGLKAVIYDTSLSLVKEVFTLQEKPSSQGITPYSAGGGCTKIGDDYSGKLAFSWGEGYNWGQGNPSLKVASIPYEINNVDVIVGTSEASDIDCSSSKAKTCYAISQEADGDILTASLNSRAKLYGHAYGAKTFKLVPPKVSSSRILDEIMPSEEIDAKARKLEDTQDQQNTSISIYSMKYNDTIDLSSIDWSAATIENGDNISYISGNGWVFSVYHDQYSIPFNLSISSNGAANPVSSFIPSANSSPYPSPSISASPYISPSPSPSESPVETPEISGGEIGGIVAGAIVGAASAIYGIFSLRKWMRGSDKEIPHKTEPSTNNDVYLVQNPIRTIEIPSLTGEASEGIDEV